CGRMGGGQKQQFEKNCLAVQDIGCSHQIAPPLSESIIVTEYYLVAGHFDNKKAAVNYAKYLRTRFVRFLVSLRKATQHATRDVYSFVPDLPLDREWTDVKLYKRYGLTEEEIAFIESQVAEHDRELFDEVASDGGGDE
ncbi:MAG: hypothetical protein ACOY8P_13515, partial [Thermodesulfobacteriota bacterium]